MQEQWVQWRPAEGVFGRYDIESVLNQGNVLSIALVKGVGNCSKVRLTFHGTVLAYRDTNESYRLRSMDLLGRYADGNFYMGCSFFQIRDSVLLQTLAKRGGWGFSQENVKHFLVTDEEFFFDIIATQEPVVDLILDEDVPAVTKQIACMKPETCLYDALSEGDSSLEQWFRWEPAEGLGCQYKLEKYYSGPGKEELFLRDLASGARVVLGFGFVAGLCRYSKISNESMLYKKNAFDEWAFFKVKNSQYLQWFAAESYDTQPAGTQHFAIVLGDVILDVLNTKEPIIKIEPEGIER